MINPQTNGICERFHKTLLDEFYCYGKTPMQTFIDTLPVAKEKLMQAA
jgi:transposase InsO family protein